MKLTINSEFVHEKVWNKDGRSGVIRTQEAIIETRKMRMPIRLDLGKTTPPHKVGEYIVEIEDNLVVSAFGDLQLKRALELSPAKPVSVAKAG